MGHKGRKIRQLQEALTNAEERIWSDMVGHGIELARLDEEVRRQNGIIEQIMNKLDLVQVTDPAAFDHNSG
jgi:hypothetical protein